VIIAGALTSGCLTPENFGKETTDLPAGPSELYEGEAPERPRVEPRVMPDVEAGALSLAQCIHVAMQNSPQARISWQSARAAGAAVGQNWGRMLPQLNFTAAAQRVKYQVLTEVEASYQRTTYEAKFGVRQLLYDGGQTGSRLSAAQAALRSADFQHNTTLQDVALQTEQAYYELLTAQAILEVAQDAVEQRQRHQELAERKLEAGRGRKVEVLRAGARLAEAELGVVESRNQVRTARGRLARSMGLSPSVRVQILDIPIDLQEEEMQDVDKLLVRAAETRPRLKAAAEEVQRWKSLVQAEEGGRLPALTANANYGWNDVHMLPEEKEEWSAALNLEWGLFTGFQRTYAIRQARARLQRAIRSYERMLRDVELDVWVAYSRVIRSRESIRAAEKYVESASETQRVAERGYEEGRATIVELIDAQTELTRSRAQMVRSRLQWYSSIARLERAVGELLSKESY
jgi:TolC family type I secretion outer membrane protein